VRRAQARRDLCILDVTAPGVLPALAECDDLGRTVLIASDSPSLLEELSDPRLRSLEALVKPFDYRELEATIARLGQEQTASGRRIEDPLLESQDPSLAREFARARRFAQSDVSVCLEGELGTGRRALAEAIHDWSPRARRPFVLVERSLLEETDLEARLEEAIDRAAEGTVALVDPAGLPIDRQRVVVEALRRAADVPPGPRWLCISDIGLGDAVREGRVEPELYYRLEDARIVLPALRDRPADQARICRALVERLARELRQPVPEVDASLLESWASEGFPGNRLGLEARLRSALLKVGAGDSGRAPVLRAEFTQARSEPAPVASVHLKTLERDAIIRALAHRAGNRTHAADDLGINVRTLRNKIREYDLR